MKDELLQACVLLATQGPHSRVRWTSSQQCQHVISSDIRPYNKKLLGTSPALQQEVALPAHFMLRTISSAAPGFEAAVRLLQGGRRPSTVKSYDHKWLKFEVFTSQAQDDAGAPRLCALPASSQTVVAYLGYLLEAGTINAKSLQPYLSAINAVHNDFEYPPPACGHLVKLARKGFAELQGSAMLQPQQVTAFPAEHMFAIVQFGLRPDASNHQVRVCACLAAQFAFFSRADSGVLLTAINAHASASTFSVNQSAKNVARNQAAPSSRVSSAQDDPHNCFNKLQLRWKCLRAHRDTDLYWSLPEDPASWFKNSGVITEWLLLLLIELDIPTPPGVKWTGHSLRRGGASAAHAIGVSIAVIMSWGLWKSLASALLYIDVSVRPSSEALFFFGHLLSRFKPLEAPVISLATSAVVSSPIDLSDALEALLELDD